MAAKKKAGKAGRIAGGFALPPKGKRESAPDARAVDRFVEGKKPTEQVTRAKPRDTPLRRSEGGERYVIYLPPEVSRALRVHCAEQRRSLSDAVAAAVSQYLKAI